VDEFVYCAARCRVHCDWLPDPVLAGELTYPRQPAQD